MVDVWWLLRQFLRRLLRWQLPSWKFLLSLPVLIVSRFEVEAVVHFFHGECTQLWWTLPYLFLHDSHDRWRFNLHLLLTDYCWRLLVHKGRWHVNWEYFQWHGKRYGYGFLRAVPTWSMLLLDLIEMCILPPLLLLIRLNSCV